MFPQSEVRSVMPLTMGIYPTRYSMKIKKKIIATASELYSDSDFISYNDNQHNRFSAAINKLLEFIGADIPEKAAASRKKT